MSHFAIRPALTGEAAALSALCFRSKAHWGYDAAFIELSRASLTVAPELIADGRVIVAEDSSGDILGMASIAPLPEAGDFDLLHLFVEPDVIRRGAGRALFYAAAALAKARGGQRLVIHSDPNAAEFYRSMGAADAGEAPSESVPGRMLPVLHYPLR